MRDPDRRANRRTLAMGWLAAGLLVAFALATALVIRIRHVNSGAQSIPVYPGAREGGGRWRYFPDFVSSWQRTGSARVTRVLALPERVPLGTVARHGQAGLAAKGWYLADPAAIDPAHDPQIIIWQRGSKERLDLQVAWPVAGMSREQRGYGGLIPAEFLDAPLVVQWDYMLGGPMLNRPGDDAQP